MQPAKQIKYEPDPNKFDLVTHRWNSQGHLVAKNLYRMHNTGGANYYERPVGSGNLWTEGNQPCGRVEYETSPTGTIVTESKKFRFDAPHKSFTAPLAGVEKVHYELEQIREKNAALMAELDSIRKEREAVQAKVAPAPAQASVPKKAGQ